MTFQLVDVVFFEFVPVDAAAREFCVLAACADAISLGRLAPGERLQGAVDQAIEKYGHANGSWQVLERRMFERRIPFADFNAVGGPVTARVLELTQWRRNA